MDIFYNTIHCYPKEVMKEIFNEALFHYVSTSGNLLEGHYDIGNRSHWHGFIWQPIDLIIQKIQINKNSINSGIRKPHGKYILGQSQEQIDDLKAENAQLSKYLYQGPIYRVLHTVPDKVVYDGLICHCSYDLSTILQSNKISPIEKYTWIIANTLNDYGFDVNKYIEENKLRPNLSEFENEIIFPLQEKHVQHIIFGTYDDFIKQII